MIWQPIETAPQDGTEILVYYETQFRNVKGCAVASCRKDFLPYGIGWDVTAVGGYESEQDFSDKDIKCWMPLPPAPDQ